MRLPRLLDGPPPTLPGLVDQASELWWSLPPRLRLALTTIGLLCLPWAGAAAVGGPATTVPVLVANHDVGPGAPVGPDDVRTVVRPAADAPPTALRTLPDGARAATTIPEGTVLTRHDLADHGLSGSVADGRVAVAIPADGLPPHLGAGQRLDLLAGAADGTGEVVASGARVIASDEGFVWIEMTRDEAAAVTAAAAWGSVGVGLLPPDRPPGAP